MGNFNAKKELNNVHKHYQSYENNMKSTDVDHQNAIANLYSLYIKRELKALWYSHIDDTRTTEKLNDYLINWYKLIKRFKNSIK